MKKRWGGPLALFALALQLTLSFAHIHADDTPAPVMQTAAADTRAALNQNGGTDDHGRAAQDDCAICAALHLAASLVLSPPPAIAPLAGLTPAWQNPAQRFSTTARLHVPQARAPPQA